MRVCVFGDVTWVGLVSYVILGCNARRQINHIMQVHVLRVCMCRRGHACAEKRGEDCESTGHDEIVQGFAGFTDSHAQVRS